MQALGARGHIFVRDKKFYKTVLRLALPVVLQSVILIGVNITDTLMLGVYGEFQISGSSLANDFITIYMILCFGIGGGAAVLTSQYWGAKDIPSLKQTVNIMLWICLGLSVVFSLCAIFIPGRIMAIYSPEAHIIEKGTLYLRMSAYTFPLIGLTVCLTSVLRTVRTVRIPLFASVVAFGCNVFFNWVFIYGNLGAPEMQIEGAALGTLLSRIFETAIIAGHFFIFDRKVGYRLRDLFRRVPKALFRIYLRYGAPVIVSDFFMAFGNTALAIIMGHIGSSFVAANAIVAQIQRLVTVFNQGLSGASGVITGNTMGKGDTERAYAYGKTFFALAVLVGLSAAAVLLLFAPYMLLLFNIEPETVDIANQLILGLAIMITFMTAESVMTKGVLRSGGDTRFLMVADVLFLWVAAIPLGYLAGIVLQLPPLAVYLCLRVDMLIKAVWCLFRLRSRKWMRRVSFETAAAEHRPPPAEGGETV